MQVHICTCGYTYNIYKKILSINDIRAKFSIITMSQIRFHEKLYRENNNKKQL